MNYSINIWFFFLLIFVSSFSLSAQTIFVQNSEQLKSAVNSAQPGDTIIIRNGQFDTDGSVTIRNNGTAAQRIVIMSELLGGTVFVNESYFDFRKCSYITLLGFVFLSSNVTAVKLQASHHIRITNNLFRISETESTKWVYIGGIWDDPYTYSHDNRVDHNIFENKTQPGNFLTIDGSNEPTYQVSQRDTIDHNLFRNNNPRVENEKESIRVGWSEISQSSGFTVIEYNLFEECNGDPEIISVKTSDNIIRNNTFRRCQGTLSLRHGNRSQVYGNFFFGENVDGTGGIRLYGDDHLIYNNYFEGLKGTKWDAPLTLTNGDYNGGTNYSKHYRINRAKIIFNTLVNNTSGIEIGFSNNGKYSKPPRDVSMENNLIVGSQNDLVSIITEPINMKWDRNIFFPSGSNNVGIELPDSQISNTDPFLEQKEELWKLSIYSPAINNANQSNKQFLIDIDGQERDSIYDIGADEFSFAEIKNQPLTEADVGPKENIQTDLYDDAINTQMQFFIKQNYPNPFNSSTTIEYYLPKKTHIEIRITDILGNIIEKHFSQAKEGLHTMRWNAADNSSGIYFFQLLYEDKVYSNKMVYLK